MRTQRVGLAALIVSIAAIAITRAEGVPGPRFEEEIALREAAVPRISPDGTRVVFQVRTTDWQANRFDSELWLAVRGQPPFPLSRTADGSSSSPKWSPDGRWIAFLARRGEQAQIHLIRAEGGEARPVTEAEKGVDEFEWAPDGQHLAFTSSEPENAEAKQREKTYGRFAVEDQEYQHQHLWLVDVASILAQRPHQTLCFPPAAREDAPEGSSTEPGAAGETEGPEKDTQESKCPPLPPARRLTRGDFTVRSIEWSPDGSRIAFERRDHPDILSFFTADLHLLDVETGESSPLASGPGFDGGPRWSPDSKWVLYYSDQGNTTSNFYRNGNLMKISVAGGSPQRLAADFDEQISVAGWTPNGIYFLAWQRMQRQLFLLDPDSGRIEPITSLPERIWSVDFSADGSFAAMEVATRAMDEIYWTTTTFWELEQLTHMSEQIADWAMGTREVVRWPSHDGTEIEGVLYKPDDFDPNRKYPLFVVIHGGPTGIDFPRAVPGTVYPILQWLAKGALVLRPNYRGSAGYGEGFRSLNVRNLGVGDAWDVLSGVDHLTRQGFVDENRMGAMGWSQGGYISAFLTTSSDRFQAISVGAGISDWMTYYVNTDIHPFTRQYLASTPWEDPEIYARTSPITNIRNASTPTLIQHGEFDRRVPIPNAYELYQGLQDVGVDTKLIVYKGFGHGINKPKERLAAIQHNWDWFAKYVWREEPD